VFTPSANPSLTFPLTGGKAVATGNDPDASSIQIAQLTCRLVDGDEVAFREFHARYFDRLYRFLLAVTHGNEQEAQEALQQTFLRILRYVRTFEREDIFWSWLKMVARSAACDGTRKQRRYLGLLERFTFWRQQGSSSATLPHEESWLLALLEESLAQLAPEDRLLLESKYVDGFTIKELAAQNGVTDKSLESRLERLRRSLRKRILKKLSTV
jgi:RNA polymerase sigma-70 factor (ECF subfamily)